MMSDGILALDGCSAVQLIPQLRLCCWCIPLFFAYPPPSRPDPVLQAAVVCVRHATTWITRGVATDRLYASYSAHRAGNAQLCTSVRLQQCVARPVGCLERSCQRVCHARLPRRHGSLAMSAHGSLSIAVAWGAGAIAER